MNPLVSIIVPIYNAEEYLTGCVESILNQEYYNIEVILVDDGSTDRSSEICDFYASQDNRVKVIHKSNGGVSAARNAGLRIVKGKYIGFVDADDSLQKEMYKELVSKIESENTKIAMCGYQTIFDDSSTDVFLPEYGPIKTEELFRDVFNNKMLGVLWNKIFDRELIFTGNGIITFDERVSLREDVLFLSEVCKNEMISVVVLNLYNYYIRKNTLSHGNTTDKSITVVLTYNRVIDNCLKYYPNLIVECSNNTIKSAVYNMSYAKKKNRYYYTTIRKTLMRLYKYCNSHDKLKVFLCLYSFPFYLTFQKVKNILNRY